jgi:hypothetical protein
MNKYYSKSTNGFYADEIHDEMPSDVVQISDEAWSSLLDGQANGKIIQPDAEGNPALFDSVPTAEDLAEISVRNSAIAKLSALGLTVDEIKSITG